MERGKARVLKIGEEIKVCGEIEDKLIRFVETRER